VGPHEARVRNRDKVTQFVSCSGSFIVIAMVEMQFSLKREAFAPPAWSSYRRSRHHDRGHATLHVTDGISGNWLGAAIIAAGTLVGLVGYGRWRFAAAGERGSVHFTPEVTKFVVIGLVGVAWRSSPPWAHGRLRRLEPLLPVHLSGLPGDAVHGVQRDVLRLLIAVTRLAAPTAPPAPSR
jgi:hypothetical protein